MLSKIISGQKKLYINSVNNFKKKLLQFLKKYPKYLIVYHGDCDGIVSAIILNNFLKQSKKNVKLLGVAQFRKHEYNQIKKIIDVNTGIIFLEGYGMSEEYSQISNQSANIDHHPVNELISLYINPRKYNINPNPSNALLTYEIFYDKISDSFENYVWLASIMDYCFEASEKIKFKIEENILLDLKNLFFSIQYNNDFTNYTVEFLSEYKDFKTLLQNKKLYSRKKEYTSIFNTEFETAKNKLFKSQNKIFTYQIEKSNFRISSSIANRISDLSDDKLIIIIEKDKNKSRLSVRNRNFNINIGKYLNELCENIPDADATGHEKAASVRINNKYLDYIIKNISKQLI